MVGWKRVNPPGFITAPEPSTADTIFVSGGVVSLTVTLKLAEPTFPLVSIAVHVKRVVPSGNVDPELRFGTGDDEHEMGSGPSTASIAVASGNVATAPPGPVASFVIPEGTAKKGGVVCST